MTTEKIWIDCTLKPGTYERFAGGEMITITSHRLGTLNTSQGVFLANHGLLVLANREDCIFDIFDLWE